MRRIPCLPFVEASWDILPIFQDQPSVLPATSKTQELLIWHSEGCLNLPSDAKYINLYSVLHYFAVSDKAK